MGFSANYKARAWMVTVQEKNCINLEIKEYEDPEVLAKTLTQILVKYFLDRKRIYCR